MSDYEFVLYQLDILENLSKEYKNELMFLSRKIRNDIWQIDINSKQLGYFLQKINNVFSLFNNILGSEDFYSLNTVIEYVKCLAKYSCFYAPSLPYFYFNELVNDLQLDSAKRIIDEQWRDILSSEDGYKSFLEIFDDVFTKAILLHKDKFFHKLSSNDYLCRVVEDINCDKNRFIPWPSKTQNRWNPPNTQFLYLSFAHEKVPFSKNLTVNEFVCLEEIQAKKGVTYSFCDFLPTNAGNILDLSYNDISMTQAKNILNKYFDSMIDNIYESLISEPDAFEKYKDKNRLKQAIEHKMSINPIDESVLIESFAKQYLIMICRCIYKKVDKSNESKLEETYKSFHILSKYLQTKGVTGIIYPCTRTNKVCGKNLVLFDVNDAMPIESTIREYICT